MNQRLICITGMDGVGKSSAIEYLSGLDAEASDIWDLVRSEQAYLPFKTGDEVDGYLCDLTPDSRLLFLSHALRFSIDAARSKATALVLLNAYIYKYFATELALGASPSLVEKLIDEFPIPDLVVYLTIPIEVAAKRRQAYSRYECGLVEAPHHDAFVSFQELVKPHWDIFNREDWFDIDGTAPKEVIGKQILEIIQVA